MFDKVPVPERDAGAKYVAMLVTKSPMSTSVTAEPPYSVRVTHTSVTRLDITDIYNSTSALKL